MDIIHPLPVMPNIPNITLQQRKFYIPMAIAQMLTPFLYITGVAEQVRLNNIREYIWEQFEQQGVVKINRRFSLDELWQPRELRLQ